MDVVSRVLIFFIFMIVHNDGHFSPMRTLISFYTMVGIMAIFNMVFNERRNFCSSKYWLGKCKKFHSEIGSRNTNCFIIFQRLSSILSVARLGENIIVFKEIIPFIFF